MQEQLRSGWSALSGIIGQATKSAADAAAVLGRAVVTEVAGARCLAGYNVEPEPIGSAGPGGLWKIHTARAKKPGAKGARVLENVRREILRVRNCERGAGVRRTRSGGVVGGRRSEREGGVGGRLRGGSRCGGRVRVREGGWVGSLCRMRCAFVSRGLPRALVWF